MRPDEVFVFITNTMNGTPLWVWVILAYLLYIGIKATRDRTVYLPKLFIIPIVFIVLNYKNFTSGDGLIIYIVFMLLSFFIGFAIVHKTPIKIFKKLKAIELPGDYSTIVILLSFFFVKYVFGYLQATQPAVALQYSIIELFISGLVSGYFLGKAFCYLYRFYKD